MIRKKTCACVAPSMVADSSSSRGQGVEEALHQPGVHAQRAAQVEQQQAPRGVEADRRPQVGDRARRSGRSPRSPGTAGTSGSAAATAARPGGPGTASGRTRTRPARTGRPTATERRPAMSSELRNQRPNAVRANRLAKFSSDTPPVGTSWRRGEGAERVERRRDHEHDREEREQHGQHADQVPPADLANQRCSRDRRARTGRPPMRGHEYTSSCARVRRKLIAETDRDDRRR